MTSEKVRRRDSLLLTVGSQHQHKVCAMKRGDPSDGDPRGVAVDSQESPRHPGGGRKTGRRGRLGRGQGTEERVPPPPSPGLRSGCADVCVCVYVCVGDGGHSPWALQEGGGETPLSRNPAPRSSWQRLPPPGAPTFQQVPEPELPPPPPPVPPALPRPCSRLSLPLAEPARPEAPLPAPRARLLEVPRPSHSHRGISRRLFCPAEPPASRPSTCFPRQAGSRSLLRSWGHVRPGPRRRRFRGRTPAPVLQKGGSEAEGGP